MEVHSHSHTPRKKGIHYVWELFVLSLAVFLGFMTENLREHILEHKREKRYVRSIVEDLGTDTAWMNSYIKDQRAMIEASDSVIMMLKNGSQDSMSRQRTYYLTRMAMKLSSPNKINYTAYEQIRSSGNLRLIREQSIIDSISHYYFDAKDIEQLNQTIMQRQASVVECEGRVFDGNVFQKMEDLEKFEFHPPSGSPLLITNDKNLINDFVVRLHYLVSANVYSIVSAQKQKDAAVHLIRFLKEEYHMK